MKEYLIIMRGGSDKMANLTETESAEDMRRWGVYMNNLALNGHLVGGLPLQPDGRVINKKGVSKTVVLSDAGEAIGGYLIIKANDYSQAVKLVKNCPIFEHNGNVEVREMAPMEM